METANTIYDGSTIARYYMDENKPEIFTGRTPSEFLQPALIKNSEIAKACNRYANDTWAGLKRMSETPTGYPEDMISLEGVGIPPPILVYFWPVPLQHGI